MRRILTVLVLLTAIGAAIYLLFEKRISPLRSVDPWAFVPEQTAIIISVPDAWNTWDRFTHTSLIWEACKQIAVFNAAGEAVARTVVRMQEHPPLKKAMENAEVMVCLLRDGSEDLGGLFIGIPQSGQQASIESFGQVLGLDNASLAQLRNGNTISYKPDTALPELFLKVNANIWLLATSSNVMEEATLQAQSGRSILQDDLLQRMKGTFGSGTDANVLLQTRRTARLLDLWFSMEQIGTVDVPDGWLSADVRSRPDALLLSGLFANDGASVPAVQVSGRSTVQRVLPASVSTFKMDHVEDPIAYLEAINSTASDSLKNALFSWVNGSVGHARSVNADGTEARWIFLEAENTEDAQTALRSVCAAPCEQQEYRRIVLQRIPWKDPFGQLLAGTTLDMQQPWCIALGDIILFSDDVANLRSSIDVWHEGNSLAEDPRASAWFQRISSEAGRTWWCDVARSGSLIQQLLRTSEQQAFIANSEFWQRLGSLSVQVIPGQRGFTHVTAGLHHAPLKQQQGNGVLWETNIGAAIASGPFIVRNHNNNTHEVLVQDANHKIHLLGSTGQVLWSKQLEGEMLGGVHQVDRFKNGKLQLLFNTATSIHMIDRNGKDVGGFPVKLNAAATAPLAVFDYENDREYRILVGTADARILNFDPTGRAVNGWNTPVLPGTAVHSVEHLRIKNKDFLLVADATGKVNIFDRKGQVRERSSLELGTSPRIERVDAGADIMSSTISWHSADGDLRTAKLSGERIASLPEAAPKQLFLHDLDGDGKPETIHINKDSLMVTGDDQLRYTRTFSSNIRPFVSTYHAGKKIFLNIVTEDGKVRLIDENGRDQAEFPGEILPAMTDLNLDNIPELITSDSKGRMIAYSLHSLAEEP